MAKDEKTSSGEKANEAKEPTVEELLTIIIANSGPERTLALMVQIINDAESRGEEMSLGVSLLVSGRLMTGQLIGHKKYYKDFGRLWTNAMAEASDEGKSLAETFAEMGEDISRKMHEATERLGWNDPRLTPAWINVDNVKILYPRPEANLVGPFRIRVSAIDAVTIGSASTV